MDYQEIKTENEMITMELTKGRVTLLSIPQIQNVFKTNKYSVTIYFKNVFFLLQLLDFVPRTLFGSFRRVGNLYLLAISLIMLIDSSLSPFYRWITIFPMGLGVVVYMVLQFLLDHLRCQQDHIINNQTTRRGGYEKNSNINDVKWMDLKVGDILYLTKGDIAPADLILLDTGQVRDREALCMLDTQYYDGHSSLAKKKSSYLTQMIVLRTRQKGQYPEYRKILSGKLEYEGPNHNTTTFNGNLKLKKDPKREVLTYENFIPKGSKIKQTSWLFALVVYTGENTKTAKSTLQFRDKDSFQGHYSNKLSLLMVLLSMFFTLISIIVLLARSDDISYMKIYDPNTANGMKVFNMFILYSQIIPANLFLIYDIMNFINKFIVESHLIKKDAEKFIKIHNPQVLADLGHVDYMLIDKTGTLTTSYYKLDSFLFGTQQFTLNHDQLLNNLNVKVKKPDDEDEPINKLSFPENEYLIALEYDPMNAKKSNGQVINTLETTQRQANRINQLKSVKTNANSQIFKQVQGKQVELTQNKTTDFSSNQRRPLFAGKKKSSHTLQNNNNDEFLQMVSQYKQLSPQSDYQQNENDNSLIYDSFLKCIMLCHEARPIYIQQDVAYESYSKNEEIALEFARLCGYSLEQFNKFEGPDAYLCKVGGQNIQYQILGLNNYTQQRNLTSIVIQSPQSSSIYIPDIHEFAAINQLSGEGSKNKALLICKGDYEAIKGKLEMNQKEREELDSMVQSYKRRGIRLILYTTKALNMIDAEKFRKQFNILHSSLTSQSEQLEQLAIEFEKNLNIIGMIGFKEELKQDALELIQTTKHCNINAWLLSGDEEAATISCAQALELCDSAYQKNLKISGKTKQEIFFEINTAIGTIENELKKQQQEQEQKQGQKKAMIQSSTTILAGEMFQRINKFVVIINGHSLAIIQDSPDIMGHFRYLSCACKNLIGYNLSPQQKELICLMVRNFFPGDPIVLAIGDGYNDALMMQAANVSIELLNSKKQVLYPEVNAGDIIVNNLSDVKLLLLEIGKLNSERMSNFVVYIFYCSGLLGMTLFFFNWFCQFTATSLHDSMTIFLFMFLFIVPNSIALGIFDSPTDPLINLQLPALYVDGQIKTRHFLTYYLLEGFFESFLTAAWTFYTCAYMINYSTNNLGWQSDLQMISTAVIYSLILIATFKVFFRLILRGVAIVGLIQVFVLGLGIGFVLVNNRGEFSEWDYQQLTQQLFTRYNSIVAMIFSICGAKFINYVIHDLIRFYYLPTVYEQFAFLNKDGTEYQSFSNKEILSQTIDQQIHVSTIVQKVFQNATSISPYIQEMLNPGDTRVTEMKIKKLNLEMKESVLEQKFLETKLEPSLQQLQFFAFVLLMYFLAYGLTDFFINDQKTFGGVEYLIVFVIFMLVLVFIFTEKFKERYYTQSHLLILLLFAVKVAIDWLSLDFQIVLSATLVSLFTTLNSMNMSVVPIVVYNIIYLIQLIIRLCINVDRETLDTSMDTYSQTRVSIYAGSTIVILIISIIIRLLFSYYESIKQRRNDYLARYQIEQDNMAAHDILSILVPKFVQQSISRGVYSMQEAQNDVSILFCYICDFDSIMREEGKNVVLMLDSLFRVYDNLCLQHGVQKIETVGYTYMAATGIKACEAEVSQHMLRTEKTMRLVNLAHDMVSHIVGRKYGKGNQIEIKIGIHVGRVIAGVIGHHKPQFSLIGDPVNQTSRIGSTGDTGAITLSEIAFKQARQGVSVGRNDIKFYEKKFKEAKGLGQIETYQVFKTKPVNYVPPAHQLKWQNITKKVINENVARRSVDSPQMQSPQQKGKLLNKLQVTLSINPAQSGGQDGLSHRNLGSPQPQQGSDRGTNFQKPDSLVQIPEQLDDSEILQAEEQDQKPNLALLKPNILLGIGDNQEDIKLNFQNILKEQNLYYGRIAVGFLWVTYFMITLITLIVRQFFDFNLLIFVLRAIFLIILMILFPFLGQAYKNQAINMAFYIIFMFGAFTILFQAFLTSNREVPPICLLELLYILIVSCHLKLFTFIQNLSYMIATLGVFLGFYIKSGAFEHQYVYYLVCAQFLILIGYHRSMSEQIQIFNNLQINEEKKIKQIALVSQLLPTHAYLKMKNSSVYNKQDFIDEFDDVTMLFADIKGFTEYSHSTTPEGVVNMLRNLFTDMDKMCLRFNVYKVYTIGDCYVVMGFTNSAKRNPIQEAINTIKMGFSMIEIIQEVRIKINFPLLNMRIGIHTGQVIGGIIGTDIVRYDLYGKDVSIANKMESSGVEGRVMISESTKNMIERSETHPFQFKFEKDVDLSKFNMSLKGYLVEYQKDGLEHSGVLAGSPNYANYGH